MRALTAPADMADKTASEGLIDLPYRLVHQKISHVATHSAVPVGCWGSVAHSHNAFFSRRALWTSWRWGPVWIHWPSTGLFYRTRHGTWQCLIWSLPKLAGVNPWCKVVRVALRCTSDLAPLLRRWPKCPSQAVRLRCIESYAQLIAVRIVNPGIVAQRMEGAVVFALTAALYGQIDVHQGVVEQKNLSQYAMLKLAQAPRVETHVRSSERAPGGLGEPGVPALAPAVATALFALTGKRCLSLPLAL